MTLHDPLQKDLFASDPSWSTGRHNGGSKDKQHQVVPQFKLLETSSEERNRRWTSHGIGSVVELGLVVCFFWLATFFSAIVRDPERARDEWSARVILPTWVPPRPVNREAPLSSPRIQPPKQTVELPKALSKPIVPPVTAVVRPTPQPPKLQPTVLTTEMAKPALPKWQPKVQLGSFESSDPAVASLKLPVSRVQTGGFGSPNGLPGHAEDGSQGNVPRVGLFDLPSGYGNGNGSGGEHGARGTVASAGFGNGIAGPGQGQGAAGQVQSSGFADARSLTQVTPVAKPREAAGSFEPVEITVKPNPVYTDEARRLRIQGEVLLLVVFTASGQLRILAVTQGLGFGLNEAATRAAQQIQFKPARRNGQPVDTTATLRILFQLAD